MSAKLSKAQQEVMDLINNYGKVVNFKIRKLDPFTPAARNFFLRFPNAPHVYRIHGVNKSTLKALSKKGLIHYMQPEGYVEAFISEIPTNFFLNPMEQATRIVDALHISPPRFWLTYVKECRSNWDSAVEAKVVEIMSQKLVEAMLKRSLSTTGMASQGKLQNSIEWVIRELIDSEELPYEQLLKVADRKKAVIQTQIKNHAAFLAIHTTTSEITKMNELTLRYAAILGIVSGFEVMRDHTN